MTASVAHSRDNRPLLSSFLTFLTFLSLACHVVVADSSAISGEFNCSRPLQTVTRTTCLPRLADPRFTPDFDVCKTSICYLFIISAPFVIYDQDVFDTSARAQQLQRPIRCNAPTTLHSSLRGISFELHKRMSSGNEYCIWAGADAGCTFNSIVDYTDLMAREGYQFGITSEVLETPQRQCRHKPSAPLLDSSMIIVGRTLEASQTRNPLIQLLSPFRPLTWLAVGAVVITGVAVCVALAARFRHLRAHSLPLLAAFFILAGEPSDAVKHEQHTRRVRARREAAREAERAAAGPSAPAKPEEHGISRGLVRILTLRPGNDAAQRLHPLAEFKENTDNAKFRARFRASAHFFRVALGALSTIFVLFYASAVVNFLFLQNQLELSKSVSSLTTSELRTFSVLKNSALESVWNATVNVRGAKFDGTNESAIPWQRCNSGLECIRFLTDDSLPTQFDVTYDVAARYLLQQASNCGTLSIFTTRDSLYQFNAGWLYNSAVNDTKRRQIDRELIGLRINGTIRQLIDVEVSGYNCMHSGMAIGPLILFVPILVLVLPPLLGAVFVIWSAGRPAADGDAAGARRLV